MDFWLKRNQTEADFRRMYGRENYYAYLHSAEFKQRFLQPIGETINKLGDSVLDVGCGEGWLADFVAPHVRYVGFDGSIDAIKTASDLRLKRGRRFLVDRVESFSLREKFDVIMFGGILHCLIKEAQYLSVLNHYRMWYNAKYFIVYDLQRLDTKSIDYCYKRVEEYCFEGEAVCPELPRVKRQRKVAVYKCQR